MSSAKILFGDSVQQFPLILQGLIIEYYLKVAYVQSFDIRYTELGLNLKLKENQATNEFINFKNIEIIKEITRDFWKKAIEKEKLLINTPISYF